jgi:hypothetical protein
MKDNEITTEDMLPEYDFSSGVRGKYAEQAAKGSNIVVLSPDVAAAFPNDEAVNNALRALLAIARQNVALNK